MFVGWLRDGNNNKPFKYSQFIAYPPDKGPKTDAVVPLLLEKNVIWALFGDKVRYVFGFLSFLRLSCQLNLTVFSVLL